MCLALSAGQPGRHRPARTPGERRSSGESGGKLCPPQYEQPISSQRGRAKNQEDLGLFFFFQKLPLFTCKRAEVSKVPERHDSCITLGNPLLEEEKKRNQLKGCIYEG